MSLSSLFTVEPTFLDKVETKLEQGHVVYFPTCPFPVPGDADQEFLRQNLAQHLVRKNVSYHPEADAVRGLKTDSDTAKRVTGILRSHGELVSNFLRSVAPELTRDWRVATCSFRPVEERGRKLSAHASNELLHVDAGAYGATHGDRILRFFVNLNPTEDRVWISKGPFSKLFPIYGRAAGFPAEGLGRKIDEGRLGKLFSNSLRRLSTVIPGLDHLFDTSPYDRAMRQFHNYMKDTAEFQQTPDIERFVFKPFSAWLVFTDAVSHACLSGRYALVSTFIVPMRNCRLKSSVPFHILRGSVED